MIKEEKRSSWPEIMNFSYKKSAQKKETYSATKQMAAAPETSFYI